MSRHEGLDLTGYLFVGMMAGGVIFLAAAFIGMIGDSLIHTVGISSVGGTPEVLEFIDVAVGAGFVGGGVVGFLALGYGVVSAFSWYDYLRGRSD